MTPTPNPARISVALCTYNSGAYIDAQLRSILDQDLPVTEVVVGDDGSTDGTVDRIQEIAASHPHGSVVRIAFTERAGGVVANFSRTLAVCTGEFIALSDHDDVWHPHKTATLVPVLQQAGACAMVFSNARLIDADAHPTGQDLFTAYDVSDEELADVRSGNGPSSLVKRNIVTGATAMFTRDLLDVALPIPADFVHDEWLAFIAGTLGTLAVETTPLIDYRVHGTNQIGVPPSSLWGQVRVALRGRRSRYQVLGQRASELLDRVTGEGAGTSNPLDSVAELLAGKIAFESARAALPTFWPARLPGIMRRYRRGDYARYTHRPHLERWRDLIQPM